MDKVTYAWIALQGNKAFFSGCTLRRPSGERLLSDITWICLTDAVYNTAATWREMWKKVGKTLP